MKFKPLGGDEGVTPVIGIILIVSITVILGSVIGGFVFDLGSGVTQTAPQASFEFDYDDVNNELTISHTGGDKLPESEVFLRGFTGGPTTKDWTGDGDASNPDDEFEAGASVTISIDDDDEIRVVWESQDENGETAILAEWDGPKA